MALLCSMVVGATLLVGCKPPPLQQNYLALGDSLAFAFQEQKFLNERATHTYDPSTFNTGYVDFLTAKLSAIRTDLRTTNYSCPGETTVTFINGGCSFHIAFALHNDYPASTSQQQATLAFLAAHPDQVSPITLDLGANDLYLGLYGPCNYVRTCVDAGLPGTLAQVRTNLDEIVSAITNASPRSEVILFTYYNPFVLSHPDTASDIAALNTTITAVATAHHARIADAFKFFNVDPPQPATLCTMTLVCAATPDIHPSDTGYAVIGQQFLTASGYASPAP